MLATEGWDINQALLRLDAGVLVPENVRWQDPDSALSVACIGEQHDGNYRLWVGSDLIVDIFSGTRTIAYQSTSLPQSTVDQILNDLVLPRLLAHAGAFIVHAGAVQFNDRAILLMGPSGRGKSTLSASFDRAGSPLLGDDAMIVSSLGGAPRVRPVYPSLRLFPDSIAAMMLQSASADSMSPATTKRRFEVANALGTDRSPISVAALFSIAPSAPDGEILLRHLSTAEACMALIESSFALDPTDLTHARRRMDDASALARQVPAFELHYPRNYDRLPEVRQAILDQIASLEDA